jgi:hypothetical protein
MQQVAGFRTLTTTKEQQNNNKRTTKTKAMTYLQLLLCRPARRVLLQAQRQVRRLSCDEWSCISTVRFA